jgi:UDP-GlcNAc3NAcA epimerase
MKVLTVVGARPQFIKAVVVSRAIRRQGGIKEVAVHTGQHYDMEMSGIFYDELNLPKPKYHLGIGSGPQGAQTGRMLEAVERVLVRETPDVVLVYGDTNSTLAGALAAAKLHIPVGHVEAGLRSFNVRMPEEVNRVLVDHVSSLLFAPTEAAVAHLRREGLLDDRIYLIGDVMYDAALLFGELAKASSTILERLGLVPDAYVLATVHRAENTDDHGRLKAIFEGLSEVAAEMPLVLPLHPRTRLALDQLEHRLTLSPGLRLIKPVGYLDMIMLERNASLIVTDSGGVQKEAYFYRVPCVTLRDETEWVELVEAGWNWLCRPDCKESIASAVWTALGQRGLDVPSYGDGSSAEKVVTILSDLGAHGPPAASSMANAGPDSPFGRPGTA